MGEAEGTCLISIEKKERNLTRFVRVYIAVPVDAENPVHIILFSRHCVFPLMTIGMVGAAA